MVNGRCLDRCGLHQKRQRLLSFSLGKPRRQIAMEKGHKTWYTCTCSPKCLGQSWAVLGGLGRSWPILAGLDRIHFIDKSRSGTEVTAKPLEKAKGHRRQEGTDQREKGVVRHRIDAGCNLARKYTFTLSFPTCIRKALLYKGELISGNAGIK